jgi:hypothetical protein
LFHGRTIVAEHLKKRPSNIGVEKLSIGAARVNRIVPQSLAVLRPTLYFSAPGVDSISSLLPCVGLSWFVTFGPKCNELGTSPCRAAGSEQL